MTALPRVFIVEDEAVIALELRHRLEELGFHVCGHAARGEDALLAFPSAAPDLVLMDVHLAGTMDGIETARRLRETHDAAVVFLTAYSTQELVGRAGDVDAFGYLVKPFQVRELDATLRLALQKRAVERVLWEANARLEDRVRERTAELEESRSRLAHVLGSSPAILYAGRAGGDYGATYVSPNVRSVLGYAPEDFTEGDGLWARSIHPDDAPRVFAELELLLERGILANEYRFRHQDGSWHWMRGELRLVRDAAGAPAEIVGTWLDVTDRKTAEIELHDLNATLELRVEERTAALARSEAFSRGVLDSMTSHVAVLDADGRIVATNAAWRRFAVESGVPWQEVSEGANYLDVCDHAAGAGLAIAEAVAAAIRDVVAGRHRKFEVEYDCHALPGERWFLCRVSPLEAKAGGRVVVSHYDVTMVHRALERALEGEHAVEMARGTLRDALDGLGLGLVLYGPDDRVEMVNRGLAGLHERFSEIFTVGATFEECIPALLAAGIVEAPPGGEKALTAALLEAHHRADGRPLEPRLPDGRTLRVSETRTLVGGIVALVADITAEVASERRLRELQKMDAVGKLTGGLAHDFNNYLGVIIGNLDLFLETVDAPPDGRRLVEGALTGALRGADLTRSLLAFARRQPLTPDTLDLNPALNAVVSLLERTLGEDVGLELDLPPDLWPVTADRSQLESCLLNLANNARAAMPAGGGLFLTARNVPPTSVHAMDGVAVTPGDYIEISVRDTGVGMPPEVSAKAFEPFFTTREAGHGTGLGLSMVYGFVRQSGGDVWIESAVGEGTTVRILLPRALGTEADGPPSRGTPEARRGTETILLVEDNDHVRRAVSAQLATAGYTVLAAADAGEALAVLQAGTTVDLLLTDVVMPGGMDGYQLATRVRELHPDLPVLLTSGYSAESRARAGEHARDFPLLAKPYRMEELLAAVRNALAHRGVA